MTFYINSNLSPTEAISMYKELQVHPIIEQWAEIAERYEGNECPITNEDIQRIIDDKTLTSAKKVKEALMEFLTYE